MSDKSKLFHLMHHGSATENADFARAYCREHGLSLENFFSWPMHQLPNMSRTDASASKNDSASNYKDYNTPLHYFMWNQSHEWMEWMLDLHRNKEVSTAVWVVPNHKEQSPLHHLCTRWSDPRGLGHVLWSLEQLRQLWNTSPSWLESLTQTPLSTNPPMSALITALASHEKQNQFSAPFSWHMLSSRHGSAFKESFESRDRWRQRVSDLGWDTLESTLQHLLQHQEWRSLWMSPAYANSCNYAETLLNTSWKNLGVFLEQADLQSVVAAPLSVSVPKKRL